MAQSAAQTVTSGPLLETKLYAPRRHGHQISRARLIERLEHGMQRKLTLVSAPAGFGKTTLLAEWRAASPTDRRPAAWVSLDESDNDPALFWAYVTAALQRVRPGVGEDFLSLLRSPQQLPIEAVLATLINEISAVEHDFALILDDFHVIEAQTVLDAVAFLLDHLPPKMHLVITGRSDPPLPIARLRGRGEVTELRAGDLRFTPEEAATFLDEVMGLDLSAADVEALETRTEGWIAGLQLAAISMQGREDISGFITAFAGDDRYIVDYLVEEVLQRQPEHVRSFLLQTSVLDRLSGPLCDAVTGRQDGAGTLAALERANLFVVPLDDKRHWYRYHHLFADVLRSHLVEDQSDGKPALHRRAAAWFEEHGMAAEAIEQARAAGDHETAARLLVANFEEFERAGRYVSLSKWAASVPEQMLRERPRLAIVCADVALAADNNNQAARRLTSWAEEAISRIEAGGVFDLSSDVDGTVIGFEGLDALKGEMLAMKLFHSARILPPDEMAETVAEALKLLPPDKHRVRGMLHMMGAGVQMWLSDLGSGLPNMEMSVSEARQARNPPLLAGILTHRGEVYVAMGRLEDGRRSFEEALLTGQAASAEASLVMCGPHTWLAEISLEHGDLAGAIDHAVKALENADRSPTRSPVLYARTTAAQVFVAAGDTLAAMEQMEKAEEFVRGSSDSRFQSFMSAVRLGIYCRTGDLEAAADVVRDRNLSPDVTVDYVTVNYRSGEEAIAYARYLLALGNYGDAEQVLSGVVPVARGGRRVRHEIQALVLRALAHELLGQRALALESLGRATMLGEPGRFNRTFTAEGPVMTALLEALTDAVRRGRGPTEAGAPSYLAFLLRESGARPDAAPDATAGPLDDAPRPAASATLPEPLSDRELEVLSLIASGATNQQIAERLVVSVSTVKSHINRTYRKLGAGSRTQAIAIGRQLGVL